MDIVGSEGAEILTGTSLSDRIFGRGGDDQILGLDGDDLLDGGAGADEMNGGSGDDTFYVDNSADSVVEAVDQGIDRIATSVSFILHDQVFVELLEALSLSGTEAINLTGNTHANRLIGNEGANVLLGGGGADWLIAAGGSDMLDGGAGRDVMEGGLGDDRYFVDDTDDVVIEAANAGRDTVTASVSYALDAAASVEVLETVTINAYGRIDLTGNDFAQTIYGNADRNVLRGGGGDDELWGYGGDDILDGGLGADRMHGTTGSDIYYVDDVNDAVFDEVNDSVGDRVAVINSYALKGLVANDLIMEAITLSDTKQIDITGGGGNEAIVGNAGSNVLDGREGSANFLTGLGGADIFKFSVLSEGSRAAHSTVTDFTPGVDHVALDRQAFSTLSFGALGDVQFRTGSAASDADDRIIYDARSGNLWYDPDGTGPTAQVLFATLAGTPILSASDFVVI